jgi:hypothetical protein
MQILEAIDVEFSSSEGVAGFTLTRTLQLALSKGFWRPDGSFDCAADDPGFGRHLMISFWAYGDTASEAFANLNRLFHNLWNACRLLSAEIGNGLSAQQGVPN